jgi:hypothetical protein
MSKQVTNVNAGDITGGNGGGKRKIVGNPKLISAKDIKHRLSYGQSGLCYPKVYGRQGRLPQVNNTYRRKKKYNF